MAKVWDSILINDNATNQLRAKRFSYSIIHCIQQIIKIMKSEKKNWVNFITFWLETAAGFDIGKYLIHNNYWMCHVFRLPKLETNQKIKTEEK